MAGKVHIFEQLEISCKGRIKATVYDSCMQSMQYRVQTIIAHTVPRARTCCVGMEYAN